MSSKSRSSMVSQWLTTKKRGRDDDKIKLDRLKAIQGRRQVKKVGTKKEKSKTTTNARGAVAKGKKMKRANDDDDDDDEDSFIVDSEEDNDSDVEYSEHEEDESVEDDIGDDDDDILQSPNDDKPSAASKSMKRQEVEEISDESDVDDNDNIGTFFQKFKHRTSVPPPAIKAAASRRAILSSKKNDVMSTSFVSKSKQSNAQQQRLVVTNPYVKLGQSKITASTNNKAASNATSRTVDLVDSDDDADNRKVVSNTASLDSSITADKPKKSHISSTKKSKYFLPEYDDDSSFESASALFNNPFSSSKSQIANDSKKNMIGNEVGDLEDTPVRKTKPLVLKKGFKNLKKRIIIDDDSDVDLADVKMNKSKSKSGLQKSSGDDYCEDDDEAVALAWALSESAKMKKGKKSFKVAGNIKPVSKSASDKTQYKDDSEEEAESINDADEGGENDQDDYIDEDAKAASSILETANALSAQVLQNMMRWTKRYSTEKTDAGVESDIPVGIISDGALVISSMDANGGDNSSSWISKEQMEAILPSVKLADYQLIGVNWISLLHSMKCEVDAGKKGKKRKTTNVNGILADEMGLGKTVQTIAFLSWLNHTTAEKQQSKNGTRNGGECQNKAISLDDENDCADATPSIGVMKPHLVIAPASVLTNWEREFQKFAPHLSVIKYHGSLQERKELKDELRLHLQTSSNSTAPSNPSRRGRQKKYERVDVILAPVTYFQKEGSDDRGFLQKFHYEYLVVDEAHLLKNARGTRYKSLDRFITNHRLLLTGTPVQNSPKELMSLLCFLMPLFSRKGSSDDDFDDNQGGHDGGESMLQHFVEAQGARDDQAAYKKLKQLFAPFVLRRRKQDVLNQILPPKERRVEFVKLDKYARNLYDSIIAEHVQAKKDGKKLNFENLFTQLRKAAHHPLLIRSRYRSPTEKDHLATWFYKYGAFRGEASTKEKVLAELEKYSDFEIHLSAHDLISENPLRREEIGRYTLCEDDLFSSSKFERLRILLPELVAKGHRILIFSGWTTVLDLLTCLMDSLSLKYMRMDGQTDVAERQDLIDSFNRDPSIPVFLLSTRASGLGITLTSAQICIMHDLDFNPFNDLQAEDRCHRIGQTQKVTVVKMVAADTVDQDVYAMQERKAKMNSAIMDNETEWKKEAKKQKDLIIETAMNRFLQSTETQPADHPYPAVKTTSNQKDDKENSGNGVTTIEIDTI